MYDMHVCYIWPILSHVVEASTGPAGSAEDQELHPESGAAWVHLLCPEKFVGNQVEIP